MPGATPLRCIRCVQIWQNSICHWRDQKVDCVNKSAPFSTHQERIQLCPSFRYSFDNRVRKGADNPTIVDMARVKCPAELVEFTQALFEYDGPVLLITYTPYVDHSFMWVS